MLSLGAVALAALALGLGFYGYVADRVVFEDGGRLRTEKFGPVDAVAAALLTALLTVPVLLAILSSAAASDQPLPTAGQMISGVVVNTMVFVVIIGGIFGALSARGIRWREIFGFDRMGPVAVLVHAVILFALAYPLTIAGTILWGFVLAAIGQGEGSPQELVRFLATSDSLTARLVVAGTAVFAAPVFEELMFRGYLYGVVRRYAGVAAGIFCNAALFAAIHTNLPSFGGLFVLAVCLTLAYEWTGSIFVSMTMHSLFNVVSVLSLFHGGPNSSVLFHAQ